MRDLAWKVLIEFKIDKLPVDLKLILKNLKIYALPYSESWQIILKLRDTDIPQSGFYGYYQNQYYIFFNDKHSVERQRFTIAHELGHILLKHYFKNKEYNQLEKEANMFAARLLMPMCILNALNYTTAEQIAQTCLVSLESANWRLSRLKMLKKRNKFLSSPLEIEVLGNFKDYLLNK